EVQVTNREVRTVNKDRVERPGTFSQVLDVLISTVFSRRSGTGGFSCDACLISLRDAAQDRLFGLRWSRQWRGQLRVGGGVGRCPRQTLRAPVVAPVAGHAPGR